MEEVDQTGLKLLFCPGTLMNSLIKLGQIPSNQVYPRSHKCTFRVDPATHLTTLSIRTNTYARMTKRTLGREPATGLLLRDCINELLMGLDSAATLFPEVFAENYCHIREGLYALMICYSEDTTVQSVLAEVIRFLPVP